MNVSSIFYRVKISEFVVSQIFTSKDSHWHMLKVSARGGNKFAQFVMGGPTRSF